MQTLPLSRPYGITDVLYAIDETIPKGAILYMEGTSIATDIATFLAGRAVEGRMDIRRGTNWPRASTYHLPLKGDNIRMLGSLAGERHANPEICDHLVVYRDDRVLLEAYDVGSGDIRISDDLGPHGISRFQQALKRSTDHSVECLRWLS